MQPVRKQQLTICGAFIVYGIVTLTVGAFAQDAPSLLADRVTALTRDAAWTLVDKVPVAFNTYHPQGMVRIGDVFFVSSVEVRVRPQRLERPTDRYDRDTGQGIGHLFKISRTGQLLSDLRIGEGTIYHPGGIDYDGTNLWVPVSEYRPNGRSLVYRVAPETMTATEVLAFEADHLGAIVHDTETHALYGASWGSRRFYRWSLDANGRVTSADADAPPEKLRRLNPSHYVDYQDCKSVTASRMLCSGLVDLRRPGSVGLFRLGGLDLVDLRDGRPLHQVPILLWTDSGTPMTQNPTWFEATATGLRGYFIPEDGTSTIYIYETPMKAGAIKPVK